MFAFGLLISFMVAYFMWLLVRKHHSSRVQAISVSQPLEQEYKVCVTVPQPVVRVVMWTTLKLQNLASGIQLQYQFLQEYKKQWRGIK